MAAPAEANSGSTAQQRCAERLAGTGQYPVYAPTRADVNAVSPPNGACPGLQTAVADVLDLLKRFQTLL